MMPMPWKPSKRKGTMPSATATDPVARMESMLLGPLKAKPDEPVPPMPVSYTHLVGLGLRVDGGVHLVHGVGDGLLVALVDGGAQQGARIFVLHLAFGGGIQSFALFDGMGQP